MTSSRRESPMKPMCPFFYRYAEIWVRDGEFQHHTLPSATCAGCCHSVSTCGPVPDSPKIYFWATQNFFHFYNDEGATATALGWITITDLFGMAHIIVFQKQKHLGSSHFEMFHKCKFKIPPCKSQRLASVGFIPTWEHVAGSLLTRPGFSR